MSDSRKRPRTLAGMRAQVSGVDAETMARAKAAWDAKRAGDPTMMRWSQAPAWRRRAYILAAASPERPD